MSRQRSDVFEAGLGPLFDPVPTSPLHHQDDPATSRESAAALRGDPDRLGREQSFALEMVRLNPGSTAPELGEIAARQYGHDAEWWRQRIGRRLSELKRAYRIYPNGTKKDPNTRRRCQRWWVS